MYADKREIKFEKTNKTKQFDIKLHILDTIGITYHYVILTKTTLKKKKKKKMKMIFKL